MDNRQTYAPHIRTFTAVHNIMLELLISAAVLIIPALLIYGVRTLSFVFMGVLGSILPEVAVCLINKEKQTVIDLSAIYTGVIISLLMPPGAPIWLSFAAGFFGSVVAKLPFGRLGRSVFSPAATGFVFVSLAWNEYFLYYPAVGEKLPFLNNWTLPEDYTFFEHQTPIQLLESGQIPYSSNGDALESIFFFKNVGSIGSVSVFVIIAVLAFMIFRNISAWQATASFCATVFFLAFIFRYDGVSAIMSPFYELFCGWMLFAAVFLVGDIVTAPRFASARVVYGIFCGILAVILRRISACQGGEIAAVLIMNSLSPAIDRLAWSLRQRGISITAMKLKIKLGFEKRMKQFED